jgi:hypothetical protein
LIPSLQSFLHPFFGSFIPSNFLFFKMVVLEAAAIGAAGYGIYKGGEVDIRKTKELQKECQRESHRSFQRGELQQKNKARQQRIARVISMRRGGKEATGNHLNTKTTATTTAAATITTSSKQISNDENNPTWLATSI